MTVTKAVATMDAIARQAAANMRVSGGESLAKPRRQNGERAFALCRWAARSVGQRDLRTRRRLEHQLTPVTLMTPAVTI